VEMQTLRVFRAAGEAVIALFVECEGVGRHF
jgi:hypothetical protein